MTIGQNAVLRHVKIQEESDVLDHMATTQAIVYSDAILTTSIFAVGARLGRNDLRITLAGEGAECSVSGLVLASGKQHLDNHTLIDHKAPNCTSRELIKGIHAGSSRGVFNGRVIVRKDAQKTNADQSNKNLLLSDKALVNSNPQLEIYADDVRCTHGSTTGQLDEEAIFYLRSRGLDIQTAQGLLINGFANEIIDRVQIGGVNIYLYRILSNWLAQIRSDM
jgi:Fe-S cluster assembly protein SufD